MANFQDSRFLGLSARAAWVTFVVLAVVIGLFFMPPALKFLVEGRDSAKRTKAAAAGVANKSQDEERAGLKPEALQKLNAKLGTVEAPQKSQPKQQKKGTDAPDPQGSGLFSGWDFSVKARGTGGSKDAQIPSTITLEKLNTRDAQTFLKQGAQSIAKFKVHERIPPGRQADAITAFEGVISELAGGASSKGLSSSDVAFKLRGAHAQTLRTMAAGGADRGVLLQWLSIPVVKFIDQATGVDAGPKVQPIFTPRFFLSSVAVRQRSGPTGIAAVITADLVVRASDVESIGIIANGKLLRTVRLARANLNGERIVKVRGDATGIWSFIAYDKYGARPYSKNYAFYPRVQRFQQNLDGTYNIAFRPGSAKNSLDRFFLLGTSGSRTKVTSDPVISEF